MEVKYTEKALEEFDSINISEVKGKFSTIIRRIKNNESISRNLFKKISNDGIYSLRVKQGSNIYRGFGINRRNKLVLLLFYQKKSQKIPGRVLKLIRNRAKNLVL